jgi:hypothetical protein
MEMMEAWAWTLQGCASKILFFNKKYILRRYQLYLASAIT